MDYMITFSDVMATVITLGLGVIGFFMKRWISDVEQGNKALQQALENTTDSLNEKIEQGNRDIQEKIQKNDEKVNERINKLEENTGKDIQHIKQEINDIKGDFATTFVLREDFFRSMNGVEDKIGKVEWTPRAEEYLKNKEYKYLSPVVMVRKKDRKAMAIHSVALTNTPAINGMFPMVNSIDINNINENEEEIKMDLKELAVMLGLPETATEDEVKEAISAVRKAVEDKRKADQQKPEEKMGQNVDKGEPGCEPVANSIVLSLLGLEANARTEDVAAAVMALKAGGADAEILELKRELKERNADDLVQMALKDGKITAAQKEWAKAYALSDKEGFKSFLDKAPVVVPQGRLDLKDAPKSEQMEYDTAILKNCGISEEDVKKYFKGEA